MEIPELKKLAFKIIQNYTALIKEMMLIYEGNEFKLNKLKELSLELEQTKSILELLYDRYRLSPIRIIKLVLQKVSFYQVLKMTDLIELY